MAKIWPVYDGLHPTRGEPWAELPGSEAIALLDLRPSSFLTASSTTPRFGDVSKDQWYRGFQHVVAELDDADATNGWRAGFYRSDIAPREVYRRLIEQALVAELGSADVIRVDYEPAVDSLGRDALRIMVVIAPGSAERLSRRALKASVRLNARLQELGDERTPLIEYATELELAQDAGAQP